MATDLGIASDHAGLLLKEELLTAIRARKLTLVDFGTFTGDSVDYPDFAAKVASAVANGECARGLLVCGTGIGMSIAANKYRGVRAACCARGFRSPMGRGRDD